MGDSLFGGRVARWVRGWVGGVDGWGGWWWWCFFGGEREGGGERWAGEDRIAMFFISIVAFLAVYIYIYIYIYTTWG